MTPRWIATKTLLACEPDVNRRTIQYHDGRGGLVCEIHMNYHMRPWTHLDENNLQFVLNALNQAGAPPFLDDQLRAAGWAHAPKETKP